MYHGQAIAAVAATSSYLAEQAVKAVKVEYEVLPVVTDILEAMDESAPLLHEQMYTDGLMKNQKNLPTFQKEWS